MIAVFSLVGLALFGGGLYAIYDGWPYLVLERGFTEVIIGSIAAAAGLVMLSLAWLLRELRTLRRELAGAAATQAAAAPVAEAALTAAPRQARPESPAATLPPAAPVAVGAAVLGAGAAAAVAVAETPEAGSPAPETLERDLFGALVAEHLIAPDADADLAEEKPEPARDEAVADMFGKEAFGIAPAVHDEAAAGELPAEAAQADEPAAVVAAWPLPDETPDASDEAAQAKGEEAEGPAGDAADDAVAAEPEPAAEPAGHDEFAALRESLTSQLGGLHRPGGRIEPALAPEDDPFAEAEAWMASPGGRREPRFDAPAATAESETAPPAPAWPPRTEPALPVAPAGREPGPSEEDVAAAQDEPVDLPHEAASREEQVPVAAEPAETEALPQEEPGPEPAGTQAQAPAASDEGVVGAYQVGETHFTIYADGSIRARTPEGEYSFASMDELKVYLASEKSRLGV
ncbi:hypothetical protein [Bosea minatitlanensis]|uniref:Meckel syndrome type 1 protein n=1 Tax=Bosea minatitlanensis TaxID=128782 RepID=A0ABW0F837_9HYPH|nr:hypothetical protein [Bosea minatitlanensis]MCT4493336.1 hypothetical protein [Bosea minatitlanensis]